MTDEKFDYLLLCKMIELRGRLRKKGVEYAEQKDRFSAFKLGAAILDCPVDFYCKALATKHLVSVWSKDFPRSKEEREEKLGDLTAYLFLLWGILSEEEG